MIHSKHYLKGFTLIELITVIAVIGILAAIVMPNLSGTKQQARDSERITEVSQIVVGLELYYNQCRQYPATLETTANNGCTGVTLATFLSEVPTDPLEADYGYATDGTSFVVRATLETTHKKLADDIDGSVLSLDCEDYPSGEDHYYCKKG